ncbi:MAG: hypothetical protein IPO61_00115 [Gammaproteobacteria bacterium]|nr:hypothetical protein [Gammaproteobacteria bacterium]
MRNATGESLGCGLVFGVGAVVDGIEYWHEQVRSRGMRSEFSSGVAMIRTLWGMMRGHEGFARPLEIHISTPGCAAPLDGEFMLLVISTLQRLFLGIHPFWGPGEEALRITAIERGAQQFMRSLPPCCGRPAQCVRRIPVITAPGWIRFSSISTARSRSTANCTTSHRAAVRCTWAWPATHVS